MKKFNFFPLLLSTLFIVIGFSVNAQTYVPAPKALSLVEAELIILEKSQPTVLMSSSAAQTSLDASYIHSLKMAAGNEMIEPLKLGNPVATVLANQFAKMNAINDANFITATAEVEVFYRTLLKLK